MSKEITAMDEDPGETAEGAHPWGKDSIVIHICNI